MERMADNERVKGEVEKVRARMRRQEILDHTDFGD